MMIFFEKYVKLCLIKTTPFLIFFLMVIQITIIVAFGEPEIFVWYIERSFFMDKFSVGIYPNIGSTSPDLAFREKHNSIVVLNL